MTVGFITECSPSFPLSRPSKFLLTYLENSITVYPLAFGPSANTIIYQWDKLVYSLSIHRKELLFSLSSIFIGKTSVPVSISEKLIETNIISIPVVKFRGTLKFSSNCTFQYKGKGQSRMVTGTKWGKIFKMVNFKF